MPTPFASGEVETACATLISGALKISSFGEDGTERILSLVHPAGFVGEMFAPVANHDVIALTDSRLCVFPAASYRQAVDRFPALGRALLRRSAEDLFESRSLIALMGRRSAQQKVAGLVLANAPAASDSPCHPAARFELPLSREEMGGLLGLTIETVSRQLTRLEREGLPDAITTTADRVADYDRLFREVLTAAGRLMPDAAVSELVTRHS